jgi:3',5'-cyclic AMP phosphodiesterase CpdA
VRNATVILHLGDVYYSGLEIEMESAVLRQIERIRQKAGINIRYYSVIGNHEYYCCATGFINTLEKCNVLPDDKQHASYFCLRNRSGTWQFIGIDTGYLDSNPTNELTFGVDPDILPQEKQWVDDKIKNFSGSTVLLSHHQLFSATQQITDLKGK